MSVGSPGQDRLRSPPSGGRHAARQGSLSAPGMLAVAGLMVLAAALRFYRIGHQGFWFDEANTAQLVRLSPGKMLGLIPQSESRRRSTRGRAILIQHYRTLLPLSLYLPGLHVLGPHGAPVDQLDVIAMSSPQQPLCWWGAACNLIPSRMQRRYPVRGFHAEWTRHVLQFEIQQLVSRRPVTLTPADVARALNATRVRRDVLEYQLG